MRKKADVSIQILIFIALGLVVLVVLLAIFTGKAKIFSRNIGGDCDEQGGICSDTDGIANNKCDDEDYPIKILAKGCSYYKAASITPVTPDKGYGQCCLAMGK